MRQRDNAEAASDMSTGPDLRPTTEHRRTDPHLRNAETNANAQFWKADLRRYAIDTQHTHSHTLKSRLRARTYTHMGGGKKLSNCVAAAPIPSKTRTLLVAITTDARLRRRVPHVFALAKSRARVARFEHNCIHLICYDVLCWAILPMLWCGMMCKDEGLSRSRRIPTWKSSLTNNLKKTFPTRWLTSLWYVWCVMMNTYLLSTNVCYFWFM